MNHNIRPLTKLEQLEYMVGFYKKLLIEVKRELSKAEHELEEERKLVRRK